MANLSRRQIEDIIKKAPQGTSPQGIIAGLREKGHVLEGYPIDDVPEADMNNATFKSSADDGGLKAGLKAIGNIPSSAVNLAKNVGTAFLNPIETAKGIGKVALGGVEKLIPGEQGQEEDFNNFTGFLKERYGSLEKLQKTATEDPIGFGTDIVGLFTGGAALVGKGAAATNALSKVAKVVTNPAAKAAEKVASGVSSTARFATSQATGLNRETISQLINNPEAFKAANAGSRTEIAQNVKTALDSRLDELGGLGKEYTTLRDVPQVVTVPEGTVQKVLNKYGVKLDADNKIMTSAESRPLSAGDKTALQDFIDNYGNQNVLSSNAFLNTREALSNLAKYDAAKTGISTNISRELRHAYDEIGKTQIKGLKELDAQYAPERQLLGQLKKDIFTPLGELKDGAINRIANITGKGKENILNRMKEIVPDIEQRIKVVKAIEDIEASSGLKVGTYARAGTALFGASHGNIPLIIGSILAQPEIAVQLLKGYGYAGQKAAPILRTLNAIVNDVNNFKLPAPILNQVEKASSKFDAGLSIKAQVDLPKQFNAQKIAKNMDEADDMILKDYIADPEDATKFVKMTELANNMGIDAMNIKTNQLESFMKEVAKERGLAPTKLKVNSDN